MRELFDRLNIPDLDVNAYIDNNRNNVSALPNIAIALSGGGYRAMMNGGGALKTFDSRTPDANSPGQLGGLLQASTYIAGLSGGAWLVGSVYVNNFTSVSQLQTESDSSVWEFENSIFQGPKKTGLSIVDRASYYDDIADAVRAKSDAGFNSTITDYW